MVTEKTVIKDLKRYGGIVNITRQQSALIRWSLTHHVLADVSAEMRQRSGFSALADKMMHEESKPTCLKRNEEHVKLLVDQIYQRMTYHRTQNPLLTFRQGCMHQDKLNLR
jgi:hypothetical protein